MSTEGARRILPLNLSGKRTEKVQLLCDTGDFVHSIAGAFSASGGFFVCRKTSVNFPTNKITT